MANCFVCNKGISLVRTKGSGFRSPKRTANKHHVIPTKYKNPNDIDKTVYLCKGCHGFVHKIISTEAIKLVYQLNSNYFKDCLYKAKEVIENG